MNIPDKILHDQRYADKILDITKDTMFFVHRDGTCLDFKANRPDFYIKEDVIGKNLFSFFPIDTAKEMQKEFSRVLANNQPFSRNYQFSLGDEVKYYKCIIHKFDDSHLILQYRDITSRSLVKLKLEKSQKILREIEMAARIGLWAFDSSTMDFSYFGYTAVFCNNEDVKIMSFNDYLTYIHPEDKEKFKNWLGDMIKGAETSDILSYKLLQPEGNILNMRIKMFHREKHQENTLLEGYIQNISEIVWKAEQSNQLKSAFLANMSHEIRTPLNAILGFSRIIAETEEAEERMQYYDIVEKNNMRLQELINEILDLSKIESGMMEFNFAPVDLYTLCDDVKNTYSFRCQPGVELIFDKSDRALYLSTDRNRLFQVFSNLIGNATKFTNSGSIRFGYEKEEDQIHFHVTDTGCGIAEDKVSKIFDRFIMANDRVAGTGLGLSISKIIVEKLGGTIDVSSVIGVGTTFSFTIPYISVNEIVSHQTHSEMLRPDGTENAVEGITILVAEDNKSNYELIEAMIGKIHRLVHANDGMEAIQLYEKYHPELILMDIKMPNIDGLDATRTIRELSADIPIIAVSAYAYEKDKAAAIDSGCNEFLTKPISAEELKATINKYLKLK